ncbi:F0F1 ATP synthase subunit B [Schaalia sp. Marseille-Q2122]|uniref:F0F1 ATP synthase subunit B n=1 Tax=Schaalia sp. Marseille-Q2122 TaxID=2736604 RepID=UPI00158CBE39|nr:F0F1 ATP synthase subunit B [Schaalia sp. Marseille-Q2122]
MKTLLAAAGDHGTEGSVVWPPLYEVFYAALILLLIWVLVGKYALPKIYAILDERQAKIEEGLGAAEKAKADAASAERQREEMLREANAEAHSIRDRASEEAKGIVAAAREEAQAEAARILENAQRQIEAERAAAEGSLRTEVGILATQLAEKIVGEHLTDTALTARVVDRFLDDLERETAAAPVGGVN